MSKFFQTMVDTNLYKEWAETIDWLVDDEKFDAKKGWSSSQLSKLTKQIHKLPNFSQGKNYIYGSQKNLAFPKKRTRKIQVIFSNGESESRDFIRHIRNGIAHGNTELFQTSNGLFIEIKDYNSSGTKQTAYICFPAEYIVSIHKLYVNIKKSLK